MLKICGDSICEPFGMIFKQAHLTDVFPSEWKKELLFPFSKRATNKTLKIIVQFLYFQFGVNNLKDLFLTSCLTFSPPINSSLKTSPVLNLAIPVLTKCYQLHTKFLHLLIMGLKLEVFSQTYLKLLIKSGTKGLFPHWNKTAFLVNFFTFYLFFKLSETKLCAYWSKFVMDQCSYWSSTRIYSMPISILNLYK